MLKQLAILLAATTLAGCATPATCPETLAYVKDRLVTPYPQLEEFVGKDALDSALNTPVDQMIVNSGGIAASIAGGEKHVAEYQAVLQDEAETRAQYLKDGQTEEWIDTYFLSVRDGVTINQAFVDAVKCRQANLQEQNLPTPAS